MTKGLRIMHVISAPAAGGAEVYVKDLSLALAAAGHHVTVVFLNHAQDVGRQASYEEGFLAELVSAGVGFDFIGYKARRNVVYGWLRLRRLVRQWRPDVVHSHLHYGLLFAAFSSVPVVYTHHEIKLRLPAWAYRLLIDRIVSTYIGICAACTNVLGAATRNPVIRIDNCVAPGRLVVRKSPAYRGGAVKLFSAGRLTEAKNYSLLLAAVQQLRDLEFKLEIAGEGPLRDALEREIESRGLSNRVRLLGNVPDVPLRLAEADVFVMSSASEGLPIALLEATLTGLPLVVTNVGGCAEVPHAVGNGLVVDVLEPDHLAAALRRMIESSSQRAFFSQNSLDHSTRYRLHSSLALHSALYRKLAHAGRANVD